MANFKRSCHKTFDPLESEIDFNSFTKVALLFLRLVLLDLQPLSESASFKRKAYHFAKRLHLMFCMLCVAAVIAQSFIYGVVNSESLATVVRAISDGSTGLLIFSKALTTSLHRADIQNLLEVMRSILELRKNENGSLKIKKYLDGYNRLVKVCIGIFIFVNLLVAVPLITCLISGKTIFLVNFWFPFDEYHLTTFPFAALWEMWNGFLLLCFSLGSDLLLCAIITVISLEFDILSYDFRNSKLASDPDRRKTFASLIERHNKLLELSDRLQKIYRFCFLHSFVISALLMCLLAFRLSTGEKDIFVSMFDAAVLEIIVCQIWLLCYYGQKLMDSSAGVAFGVYDSEWTDLEIELRKQLTLIILRAQKPQRLSAMNFAAISLETFAAVSGIDILLPDITTSIYFIDRFYLQHIRIFLS